MPKPKRTGYDFAGWRYLKKDAQPGEGGQYADNQYVSVEGDLVINADLVKNAKIANDGGVLALYLVPKWTPAKTKVRVILWTEDLTNKDDVQAIAQGGNTSFYNTKYEAYKNAPVTHEPKLGKSDQNYSNMGSFTFEADTDSSLLEGGSKKSLLSALQTEVNDNFEIAMDKASGINVSEFYSQAAFEIAHEEKDGIDYNATTASADGKTTINVYFTRNVYELKFTYYGTATSVSGNSSNYCVATSTNGYSFSDGAAVPNGNLNYGYTGSHQDYSNRWMRASVNNTAANMPVPQTITIKAKYGADLRDVWPVARSAERVTSPDDDGGHGDLAKMISWGTTAGKYCKDGYPNSGSTHAAEPTIMGAYAAMSAEIVADPSNPSLRHNLVAYWFNGNISYYRNNHCFEIPNLDVSGMEKVSIYRNDTSNSRNFLYLVPTDNATVAQYDFNDLMRVSYENGQIAYDDPNGTYYAVREYNGKYYAVARQVDTVSSNAINKQNPSARLHMTRANSNADHSTQHTDNDGAYNERTCGEEGNPYDLYFYYNRDRYTITYMVPRNSGNAEVTELTLGKIELPYGAKVTKDKYAFDLSGDNYMDMNNAKNESGEQKYGWNLDDGIAPTAVCPDRHENGTKPWKFEGWALGPAGVNMQWTASEQASNDFFIEGNMRLYAIWDAPTYTVTFHLDGGTVSGSSEDIKQNIQANTRFSAGGTIPRPVKSGYTLDGWYKADENGKITEPETSFDFDEAIATDMHVVAK